MSDDQCPRCSECKDCDHHWIPNPEFGNDESPTPELKDAEYVCKHCPTLGEQCDACDGLGMIYGNTDDEDAVCLGCNGLGVIPLKATTP